MFLPQTTASKTEGLALSPAKIHPIIILLNGVQYKNFSKLDHFTCFLLDFATQL
jgi:hypothetical protein